ncbi:IS21 family transposase [Pseudomonas syringae]|uniref:IS21 family transposase n=1 Tax=Pseudomonas syringae TaxID=317 RepID=UPI0002A7975B|nr:IS21 family transposase [Pseudomonas syringae]ELQ09044.1 transposase [Pseudomonas syringae BRIP39023]MCK9712341.1 IS21 family transposase [Pseudomonas syringae pv. syringae]MCK9777044.1 IS21 family transposase [Pseudomonas syringae pv. syringae]RXF63752.1 transposase [Pseudomonas syringae]
MLIQEQAVEIRVLARQGHSIRQIAKTLGVSRNTVRRYLREPSVPSYSREPRPTKLDAFHSYLHERVRQAHPLWLPSTVLLREIRERGYEGGASQLRAWLAKIKPAKRDDGPVVRFETEPGKQMQADFIVFRRAKSPMSAFVATLGYSRMTYVHFVPDESFDSVHDSLLLAFDYFGGVPDEILFDNMKTAVIERDAYGEGQHRFHAGLLQMADDLGFRIRLCRPYRARTKGKVERFNRYLRESFYNPLNSRVSSAGLLVDCGTANRLVGEWLADVANVRTHATLKERPIDRWRQEQGLLTPLPHAVHQAWKALLGDTHRPIPHESLQHPLSIYEAIREACA